MPRIRNYGSESSQRPGEAYIDVAQTIAFDSEELPESKAWEIGKRYHVEIVVEKTGEQQDPQQDVMVSNFKIISQQPARAEDMPDHISRLVDARDMRVRENNDD